MYFNSPIGMMVWQIDRSIKNWDNPEFVRKHSRDSFVGRIFEARYNEKLAEENLQRWYDRYRHTGETWKNSPYPWTAYKNTEGAFTFSPGEYFEASEAIINQNFGRLSRWSTYFDKR